MFELIVLLSLFSLLLYIDDVAKRADEARNGANEVHSRLDRTHRAMGLKETRPVSYTDGWQPKGTWDDDFVKTTFLDRQSVVPFLTKPKPKSWLQRWFGWLR